MVNLEYRVHLRPLFVAGHDGISAGLVVSMEGQFTNVFNTLDTSGPLSTPFRTQLSSMATQRVYLLTWRTWNTVD
jgi:hypothetical protein